MSKVGRKSLINYDEAVQLKQQQKDSGLTLWAFCMKQNKYSYGLVWTTFKRYGLTHPTTRSKIEAKT